MMWDDAHSARTLHATSRGCLRAAPIASPSPNTICAARLRDAGWVVPGGHRGRGCRGGGSPPAHSFPRPHPPHGVVVVCARSSNQLRSNPPCRARGGYGVGTPMHGLGSSLRLHSLFVHLHPSVHPTALTRINLGWGFRRNPASQVRGGAVRCTNMAACPHTCTSSQHEAAAAVHGPGQGLGRACGVEW
jgi:hypothetical protein